MDPIVDSTRIFTANSSFEAYIDQCYPTPPRDGRADGRLVCAVAEFNSILTSNGNEITFRGGQASDIVHEEDEGPYAITQTTHWDASGSIQRVTRCITSPPMIKALKSTVPTYHDHIDSGKIIFEDNPKEFFHHLGDIFDYGKKLDPGSEDLEHVGFLLAYLKSLFSDAIVLYRRMDTAKHPSVSFDVVWALFKKGRLIYIPKAEQLDGVEMVVRMHSLSMSCKCKLPEHLTTHSWTLVGTYIDSVGGILEYRSLSVSVPYFGGAVPIEELCAVPLHQHSQQHCIRDALGRRGRKFAKLRGFHYCHFRGTAQLEVEPAYMLQPSSSPTPHSKLSQVDGRIMIDDTALRRTWPSVLNRSYARPTMSDDDYLICCGVMAGYSFNKNRWGTFRVSQTDMPGFDTNMFTQRLVIKEKHKKMLCSLISLMEEPLGSNGLCHKKAAVTILLYGGPGEGKTMTAESVAEHSQRPLLRITADNLLKNENCTDYLLSYFDTAQRWGAVVLIDEADLLLERTRSDDWRGRVFLRALLHVLDWHRVFVFLTTNRINSIDPAFKSRIQYSIHYPPQSPSSRRKIWLSFLRNSGTSQSESEVENTFDEFFDEELSGKQIEAVVQMARALATGEGERIKTSHLRDALNEVQMFSKKFDQGRDLEGIKRRTGAHALQRQPKKRRARRIPTSMDSDGYSLTSP